MMSWQSVAQRDPYLAGHLAARDKEWWERGTAEEAADSVGLTGKQRATFLSSWAISLQELDEERAEERQQELDALLAACDTGYDPATRTSWDGIL